MGALQTITITGATMGAVDATRFELPAEIQALKKPMAVHGRTADGPAGSRIGPDAAPPVPA
jgi:hypothetical protein